MRPLDHKPLLRGRATAIAAGLIFTASFAIFWYSPNHVMGDSQYTLLVSDNLLAHRDFHLERYHLPVQYRVTREGGHQYYWYPPGSSILSLPYVAVARLLGKGVVRPNGS